MTKVLGIIPARIGSTRIPEKMLKDIHGKTLIERTYERSIDAKSLDGLVIATDSERVAKAAESFKAPVIMTELEHKTGTDRAAEAAKKFKGFSPDIVVVIWGDEPLYPASVIDRCVEKLKNDSELVAVAAADKVTEPTMLIADSVVKIVTDIHDRALYVSRAVIPHRFTQHVPEYHHIIGAMAVRAEFLARYVDMEQTPLEKAEGVEQIRILENGYKLGVVKGDFGNLGVNMPSELDEVIRIFGERILSGEIKK